MKKYNIKLLPALVVFILATFVSQLYAQEKISIEIKTMLVDENDNPIPNALVELGDGLIKTYSDTDGNINIKVRSNNKLLINANGYKSKTIELKSYEASDKIVLESAPLFIGKDDILKLPANTTTTQRALTGAVSRVFGKDLESQPDAVFSNAIQGRLAGVSTQLTTDGLGNDNSNIFVRGLSRNANNTALTIVDGVERGIDDLTAEEIESIEVLKDATAKILYGSRAANGVISVRTKKGRKDTKMLKASVEYGVNTTSRIAEYLNSADYAILYNEALENDGLEAKYSADDIAGYQNSSGAFDLNYPNIDHNSQFLKNSAYFKKANFSYSGGNEESLYGVYLGYISEEGLEKIDGESFQERLNLRSNLSFKITDNLTAHIEGSGVLEQRKWGKLGQDNIFAKINTERPNEFPLEIIDENFEGEEGTVGDEVVPGLGGSLLNSQSLYGDTQYGGYTEYIFFDGYANFGLDLDLNNVIPGLTVNTLLNFDNRQLHQANQINNPVRYEVIKTDDGINEYSKLNNSSLETIRNEGLSVSLRNFGSTSSLNYETNINESNELKFSLSHFYYLNELNSRRQHVKNSNTVFKANYAYNNKFYLEASYALMMSNKFVESNRDFFAYSTGAAWILSEENFFKNDFLNFFKLKSSYGLLGYDASTNFYLFETRYSSNGTVSFGNANSNGGNTRYSFDTFGNPDLRWEQSKEFNVGFEGLAFNNSLKFEFNYFHENRSDIIDESPASIVTSIAGAPKTPVNLGEVENHGVDGSINWFKNYGDFKLNLGGNFLISKNKQIVVDDVNNIDSYLNQQGRASDVIFGYVSNGIFKNQTDVDEAPIQTFGNYGVGNISYEDLNDDGYIDEQDRKVIGNTNPRASFGVFFDAQYKGFGLSALGVAETGVDVNKNNTYYRNFGEDKYSVLASDRYHPVNNPDGTQPLLTTTTGLNDSVASTFWVESAAFFRLRNVEVSYTFSNDLNVFKNMRLYVRGTNLLVLSGIKDLDPEVINSGVTNYPLFRTITGGVSFAF